MIWNYQLVYISNEKQQLIKAIILTLTYDKTVKKLYLIVPLLPQTQEVLM